MARKNEGETHVLVANPAPPKRSTMAKAKKGGKKRSAKKHRGHKKNPASKRPKRASHRKATHHKKHRTHRRRRRNPGAGWLGAAAKAVAGVVVGTVVVAGTGMAVQKVQSKGAKVAILATSALGSAALGGALGMPAPGIAVGVPLAIAAANVATMPADGSKRLAGGAPVQGLIGRGQVNGIVQRPLRDRVG